MGDDRLNGIAGRWFIFLCRLSVRLEVPTVPALGCICKYPLIWPEIIPQTAIFERRGIVRTFATKKRATPHGYALHGPAICPHFVRKFACRWCKIVYFWKSMKIKNVDIPGFREVYQHYLAKTNTKKMPPVGVEPTLPCGNWILSPARLPIPPQRHVFTKRW